MKPHEEHWYADWGTEIFAKESAPGQAVGMMWGGRTQLAATAPDMARTLLSIWNDKSLSAGTLLTIETTLRRAGVIE